MSEQDFNDLHSAYPKEITQENFQSTINSLKESSKYVLNGANSKWIAGLIELSKEMHRGIMDNSADSFNYSFEEIEEWQFETAAVIANEVCAKNFEGGTDNAILVLEVHFYNLDILYEFYPDLVISNLLMSCLLIGLPQSFKDQNEDDGASSEDQSNEIISEASKRASRRLEERSRTQ